jgi:hypothetical protein
MCSEKKSITNNGNIQTSLADLSLRLFDSQRSTERYRAIIALGQSMVVVLCLSNRSVYTRFSSISNIDLNGPFRNILRHEYNLHGSRCFSRMFVNTDVDTYWWSIVSSRQVITNGSRPDRMGSILADHRLSWNSIVRGHSSSRLNRYMDSNEFHNNSIYHRFRLTSYRLRRNESFTSNVQRIWLRS